MISQSCDSICHLLHIHYTNRRPSWKSFPPGNVTADDIARFTSRELFQRLESVSSDNSFKYESVVNARENQGSSRKKSLMRTNGQIYNWQPETASSRPPKHCYAIPKSMSTPIKVVGTDKQLYKPSHQMDIPRS